MPKVIIKNLKKEIEFEKGKNLMKILLDNDIFIDNPCNGNGTCGKCKIKLLGEFSTHISNTQKKFLSREEIDEGILLSCLLEPEDDIVIETLSIEKDHKILKTGYLPNFENKPSIVKKVALVEKASLENQSSFEDLICRAFETDDIDFNLLKVEKTDGLMTGVFRDEKLIEVESGDTREDLYGLAIDIGTTTVVASLVDLNSGKEIMIDSMINPQKKYGLDVLTRITYASENEKEAAKNLQEIIVNAINDMMIKMSLKSNIALENIYEITLAANCSMLHFILGVDASSIGKAPYSPRFINSKSILAKEIGLNASSKAGIYSLPSVSSYIGADIVAGAYVSDLRNTKENVLLSLIHI